MSMPLPEASILKKNTQSFGENADARIEAVKLWANQFFSEEQYDAVERLGETAQGIEVLEKSWQQST